MKIFKTLLILPFLVIMFSCTTDESLPDNGNSQSVDQVDEAPEVNISKTSNVPFNLDSDPVAVSSNMDIENITVSGNNSEGAVIERETDKRWLIKGKLESSSNYVVNVTVKDLKGVSVTNNVTFSTLIPKYINYTITPSVEGVYGIGMPVTITFDSNIRYKENVEKNIELVSEPSVEGSWGWVDAKTLVWRPKEYWPMDTLVNVETNLKDIKIDDELYAGVNKIVDFSIDSQSTIVKVNEDARRLIVFRGGKEVLTMPASLGNEENRTKRGIGIVDSKFENKEITDNEGKPYRLRTAVRFSNTNFGYISAINNESRLGRENSSEGEVNVGKNYATLLFNDLKIGDPVEIESNGEELSLSDGLGAVWNVDYSTWVTKSSLYIG